MNCSLIDEQRINQGLLCRSMTCLKCNEFRQMNNEHKSKESCLSEMSSRIINLQKKLEAVTTERDKLKQLLKEEEAENDVRFSNSCKDLRAKLEASEKILSGDNLRLLSQSLYILGGECPLYHNDSSMIAKLEKTLKEIKEPGK